MKDDLTILNGIPDCDLGPEEALLIEKIQNITLGRFNLVELEDLRVCAAFCTDKKFSAFTRAFGVINMCLADYWQILPHFWRLPREAQIEIQKGFLSDEEQSALAHPLKFNVYLSHWLANFRGDKALTEAVETYTNIKPVKSPFMVKNQVHYRGDTRTVEAIENGERVHYLNEDEIIF